MRLAPPWMIPALAALLAAPAAATAQTTFTEVAAASGVDHVSLGRSAAMVDLDGDGLLDLVATAGYAPTLPGDHKLFRQSANHDFEDVTGLWGIAPDDHETFGVLVADLDDDADEDLYFINGGFTAAYPNQLYRNDLGATGLFTDVSVQSGAGALSTKAFGGTLLDYDLDGDLDIFISNNQDNGFNTCNLVRNDGALFFTDVSQAAGLTSTGAYRHCGAGDFNGDGWPDVGVGNFAGANALYRNEQDGTFTDVAVAIGADSPGINYGVVFRDFDNDGDLDIHLPKFQPDADIQPSTLLVNDGSGVYTDVTPGSGTTFTTDMGHNAADIDADGYPDVLLGTGSPPTAEDDVLLLVHPDGLGGLVTTDISASSGLTGAGPTRCHGVAFGDYDDDGDIDIYLNLGGMAHNPTTVQANRLWSNDGNGNTWVGVDLTGVLSSRTPVGVHAWVVTNAGRIVHRWLAVGSGFGNTDSHTLHFGLGGAAGITELHIDWPSGIEQVITGLDIGSRHAIHETGLRLLGQPTTGTSVTLQFAGAPDDVAELLFALGTATTPLAKFDGLLLLAPPLFGPISVPLGPAGRLDLPLVIPSDPALVGVVLHLQAWIHPPGANKGPTLSNRIELAFD